MTQLHNGVNNLEQFGEQHEKDQRYHRQRQKDNPPQLHQERKGRKGKSLRGENRKDSGREQEENRSREKEIRRETEVILSKRRACPSFFV